MSWTLIESQTLGSSAATVTFSSIPQTYKALRLVVSARDNWSSASWLQSEVYFNGDTNSANYSGRALYGTGDSAGSLTSSLITFWTPANGNTANTFGSTSLEIPNYAGSAQKVVAVDGVTEGNQTATLAALVAGKWSGTAAITTIRLNPQSTYQYLANSTFTLYGLK